MEPTPPQSPLDKSSSLGRCLLLLRMQTAGFNAGAGNRSELYFSLYEKKQEKPGRFISDEYVVKLSENSFPEDPSLIDSMHTLFSDLDSTVVQGKVYLLCRVYRVGALLSEQGVYADSSKNRYRCPFAVAVVPLAKHDIPTPTAIDETGLSVQAPLFQAQDDEDFARLHDYVIQERAEKYRKVVLGGLEMDYFICLEMKLIKGTISEYFRRRGTRRHIPETKRLTLNEVLDPATHRSDLYVTLLDASMAQSMKAKPHNLLVRCFCISKEGRLLPWIVRGTGPMASQGSQYSSTVYYHSNAPDWNETFCVKIPPRTTPGNDFENAHLLVVIYHGSKTKKDTPLAFSWLNFADPDGVAIADGSYPLPVYKLSSRMHAMFTLKEMDSGDGLPAEYRQQMHLETRRLGIRKEEETLRLRVCMCSTEKSQIRSVHELLNWSPEDEMSTAKLLEIIRAMLDLNPVEVTKSLREIFDALMGLLIPYRDMKPVLNSIFELCVHLLKKFNKGKELEGFRAMMKSYIKDVFQLDQAHVVLLDCLKHYQSCICDMGESGPSKHIKKVLRDLFMSLPLVLAFVRSSYTKSTDESKKQAFRSDLAAFISNLSDVLVPDPADEVIVGNLKKAWRQQSAKMWPAALPILAELYDAEDMAKLALTLMQNLPFSPPVESKTRRNRKSSPLYNCDRMNLVNAIVGLNAFSDPAGRVILVEEVTSSLKLHLGSGSVEEQSIGCCVVRKCVRIAEAESDATLLARLTVVFPEMIRMALCSDLAEKTGRRLSQRCSVATIDESEPDAEDTAPPCLENSRFILMKILDALPESHFVGMFLKMPLTDAEEQLSNLLKCLTKIHTEDVVTLPDATIHADERRINLVTLRWIMEVVQERFETQEFQPINPIWNVFLSSLFTLAAYSMSGTRANLSELHKVEEYCQEVLDIFEKSWHIHQGRQAFFADTLVTQVLNFVKGNTDERLGRLAEEIYFDLLKSDYSANGVDEETGQIFTYVGGFTIDGICKNILGLEGASPFEQSVDSEQSLQTYFSDRLAVQFKEDHVIGSAELQPLCENFVKHICQFCSVLHNIETMNNSRDEDSRVLSFELLFSYLTDMKRQDLYINFVHELYARHMTRSLEMEAGVVLAFHSKLLSWTPEPLPQVLTAFPEGQASSVRKEELIKMAVQHFDRSMCWEQAIELYKELVLFHEEQCEFEEASKDHRQLGYYFHKVATEHRHPPSYFRIKFGSAFPKDVSDKEFVYRCKPLENMHDFREHIEAIYPDAEVLLRADRDSISANDRQIRISKVVPYSEETEEHLVPRQVKVSRAFNGACTFYYVRSSSAKKLRRQRSANEFLDLWVERHNITVAGSFPSMHRRLEVIDEEVVEMNPLEVAVMGIRQKNEELLEKVKDLQKVEDGVGHQLSTMALQGIVDAAVNGGLANYEVFITGKFVETNPEIHADIKDHPEKARCQHDLLEALHEHLEITEQGLQVHGEKCDEATRPLHDHLIAKFEQLKQQMIGLLGTERIPGRASS